MNYTTYLCTGAKLNATCSINTDCDLGLYCSTVTQKCIPLKSQGQTCSWIDLCNTGLACLASVCTPYLSLSVGADVSVTFGTTSEKRWLCNSYSLDPTLSKCVTAKNLVTSRMLSAGMTIEQGCYYTDGTIVDATCSYSSSDSMNTGICDYGGGDYTNAEFATVLFM